MRSRSRKSSPIAIVAAVFLALLLCASTASAQGARSSKGPVLRIGVHDHRQLTGKRGPGSRATSARCRLGARYRQSRRRVQRIHRRARRAHGRTASARRLRRRARKAQRRLKAAASRACTGGKGQQGYTASPSSIFWGAWMGKHLTGTEPPWDMNAVDKFEQMAGKDLSVVHFGSPFSNCYSRCYFYDFPTNPMESVREHGAIPFLSWSSQSIPSSTTQPDYQLSDVAAGSYDDYIRKYAEDAAAWGHPFFLRFNWEMNGDWFSWGAGANGNSAAEYVASWRHVHDIFTAAGATNATWVWCPNIDPGHTMTDLSSLYPGDSYVDWTCLDGYNWGSNPNSHSRWASWDELYRSTYDEITEQIAPGKPMFVGETSASEYGGSKAEWIADALEKIPTEYPSIRGLLWFEKFDDAMDWPIETSESAASAFASGIQNPAFATNSFANLSVGGPIPPPTG